MKVTWASFYTRAGFPVISFQSLLSKCKTIHRINLISSRDLFKAFYQWDMNALYMKGLDHSHPFVGGYQRSSNKRKDCIYNLLQTNNLYLPKRVIFIAKMQKNINRNLKPKAHSHGECFLHGRIELFISCIHQWDIEDHQKREQSYICGLSV